MSAAIREIGIPVRSVNWVHLHPGQKQNGSPCIYAVMGQQAAGLFVLQIDIDSGQCRQFVSDLPDANYPTATCMSRSGRLYIGSAYAGHLLCFDPQQDALLDLGAIHPEAATFPCRIDEDAQGALWIGSYPSADLTSYDPLSGQFQRPGRMDEIDMYNYPLVSPDGGIANLIRMTRSHIAYFDPATNATKTIGPTVVKGEGDLDLFRGDDGQLYIESSLGQYRIEHAAAVAVDTLPARPTPPALPDGTTFSFADAKEQRYHTLSLMAPDGQERRFELAYEASGSRLFYVHLGPDECIYGSSILPLHLFRYNAKDGELIDLGVCSSATGEAYSMANLGHKMYLASYPQAKLSVYDPSQGYRFGDDEGANPRDLGRMDELSYRPRSTLTGPLGRVWTASIPDYGRWGGPLSWFDPQTEEKGSYLQICGDASCYTLAWLQEQERIAVGTTIQAGTGTQPKVEQAELFLWDYHSEERSWSSHLDRPFTTINALLTGPDGRLYGTATGDDISTLFVFDPKDLTFTHYIELPMGTPLDLGLQNGPDGQIYGFTTSCIYTLDPSSLATAIIIEQENAFTVAGPIAGDTIYFAHLHRLCAAKIF